MADEVVVLPTLPERIEKLEVGVIHNEEQAVGAADFRNFARGVRTAIEKERVRQKERHLEAGRKVDAAFRPLLQKIDAAVAAVDAKLIEWKQLQIEEARREERRREEERRKRQAEIDAENERTRQEAAERARKEAEDAGAWPEEVEEAVEEAAESAGQITLAPARAVEQPKAAIRGEMGRGVTVKSYKNFRVVDKAAVPDMYKTVDRNAVMADIRQGIENIPGIEVYDDFGVSNLR